MARLTDAVGMNAFIIGISDFIFYCVYGELYAVWCRV